YLPWNFQKLYDSAAANYSTLRALFERQAEAQTRLQQVISERVGALVRELQERQGFLERRAAESLAEHPEATGLLQQEGRQLKYRYAGFDGALAEQQKEQTRLTQELVLSLEDLKQALGERGSAADDGPAPRVVNLEEYRALLARQGDAVRVHLGGRGRPLCGYVRVDSRP